MDQGSGVAVAVRGFRRQRVLESGERKHGTHAQCPRRIHTTASASLTDVIRNAFAYSTRMLLSVPSKLAACRFILHSPDLESYAGSNPVFAR